MRDTHLLPLALAGHSVDLFDKVSDERRDVGAEVEVVRPGLAARVEPCHHLVPRKQAELLIELSLE